MKTLHLTLKKKWFDMILSGEKKEEYRECKDYWFSRLVHTYRYEGGLSNASKDTKVPLTYEPFDTVTFKNGYHKNAPLIEIELECISHREGRSDWGAEEGVTYFVISLGEIIRTENIR